MAPSLMILSPEYEEMLRSDCAKLFRVLKNCHNNSSNSDNYYSNNSNNYYNNNSDICNNNNGDSDDYNSCSEADEENLKILYRIAFLISYRQSSKLMAITIYTVKHLCHHPILPLTLIEILKTSRNLKICACVLEILAKMILKNSSVPENDRKACRRLFAEPGNFKCAVDAFQKMYAHFLQEKTNPMFYEVQLRLLKIINCLYIRKGQSQISTLSDQTVVFFGRHLTKYRMHREISQSVLPLLKTLCRNRRYSSLLCDENFLNSLTTVVPASNKYQAGITILKLLSRSPEAVMEMGRSEKTVHFILTTACRHAEKPSSRKYLMSTLYRLTKIDAGVELIRKSHLWLLLLEFFVKLDLVEDLKQRMAAVKAYTILHRGVRNKTISVAGPVNLYFDFPREINEYIADKSNSRHRHNSDDSDNDGSEDDEEEEYQKRKEKITNNKKNNHGSNEKSNKDSCDDDTGDGGDSEPESDTEDQQRDDIVDDTEEDEEEKEEEGEKDNDLERMRPFFRELFVSETSEPSLEFSFDKINRLSAMNRQAFPDTVLAESDDSDDNKFLMAETNCFSSEELSHKIRALKEECEEDNGKYFKEERFGKKVINSGKSQIRKEKNGKKKNKIRKKVYDLDKLIANGQNGEQGDNEIDVPGFEKLNRLLDLKGNNNIDDAEDTAFSARRGIDIKNGEEKSWPPPTLRFESRFESGNLRSAEQIGDFEYDLYLSSDVNTSNSGLQWFYFQVSNMLPRQHYTFNIVNFQKVNSQFNYGLQPVMFSAEDYLRNATGWRKVGEKILYYGNELNNNGSDGGGGCKQQFRTLSFTVSFPYGESDVCYLAYHFPYTYTRLLESLRPYETITKSSHRNGIYSRLDKLTDTVGGLNQVPLLTVTAKSGSMEKRPLVFVTARVHPGESNSSWIMDGVLRFLLDEQDERAHLARERYIFKIIPMLNPEGVIYGNTRCGLTGDDLNRRWKRPQPSLHPEIHRAKKLVQFVKECTDQPVFAFVDIHGHSRKKFFFLYGCDPAQSWNETDRVNAATSDANIDTSFNLLPKLLSGHCPDMRPSYCRYTVERKRESTCRVVMWREFGIKCSYTLECSFCSGENKKKMTTRMLRDIGVGLIVALASIDPTSATDTTTTD